MAEPSNPSAAEASLDDDESLLCPNCGYDLRGTFVDRCSECGTAIDRAALRTSNFPWAHRREVGRVRAYIKTVWRVTFGGRVLAYEASKLQQARDGRSFARVTGALVALSLISGFVAFTVHQRDLSYLAVQPLPAFN